MVDNDQENTGKWRAEQLKDIYKAFNRDAADWLKARGWRNNWADHNWVSEKRMGEIHDGSGVDVLTAVLLEITNKDIVSLGHHHIALKEGQADGR